MTERSFYMPAGSMPKKITRNALMGLPSRKWDTESAYDTILLVPTGKKWCEGHMGLYVVGASWLKDSQEQRAEIAAVCDDISWIMPKIHPYNKIPAGPIRTDCFMPSGIIRFWASRESWFGGQFHVGLSLSSITIELKVFPMGDSHWADNFRRELGLVNG